jgi:hypothetical protein
LLLFDVDVVLYPGVAGWSYNDGGFRQGGHMADKWKIISNSSDHLILERGSERLDISKPENPAAGQLFLKMIPPGNVTDIGVELLKGPKKAS